MNEILVQLPDDFTVAQVLRNFGRHLMSAAANSPANEDVYLRYDRDVLLEVSAMIAKYTAERSGEEAS